MAAIFCSVFALRQTVPSKSLQASLPPVSNLDHLIKALGIWFLPDSIPNFLGALQPAFQFSYPVRLTSDKYTDDRLIPGFTKRKGNLEPNFQVEI